MLIEVSLTVMLYINSICSESEGTPGIFIQSVRQGGLAAEAGLEVGDQILAVNGTEFTGITHSEAVVALKGSRQLNVTVNKYAVSAPTLNKQVNTYAINVCFDVTFLGSVSYYHL